MESIAVWYLPPFKTKALVVWIMMDMFSIKRSHSLLTPDAVWKIPRAFERTWDL